MVKFKYSSMIDAPIDVVWAFHERPNVLKLLTPPWLSVQVQREGRLEVGAVSEFDILVGTVAVKWLAVHTECEKYHFFVDQQREGPFASWQHRHLFTSESNKTLLTDDIDFSLPGGFFIDFFGSWFVMMQLDSMFRYRHEVIHRECKPSGKSY